MRAKATPNKARTAKRIRDNIQTRRDEEQRHRDNLRIAHDLYRRALDGDLKAVKMIFDLDKKKA